MSRRRKKGDKKKRTGRESRRVIWRIRSRKREGREVQGEQERGGDVTKKGGGEEVEGREEGVGFGIRLEREGGEGRVREIGKEIKILTGKEKGKLRVKEAGRVRKKNRKRVDEREEKKEKE